MMILIALAVFLLGLGVGLLLARPTRTDVPAAPALAHADDVAIEAGDSAQLHLCRRGLIEHEIAWHGDAVPGHYTYAGKRYVRHGRREDGSWEFRR